MIYVVNKLKLKVLKFKILKILSCVKKTSTSISQSKNKNENKKAITDLIFDCCKQSLNPLQHPSIHPPIHPVPECFCTKSERLPIYCLYLLLFCASCFSQIFQLKIFNSQFSTKYFQRKFSTFSISQFI